MDGQEEVRRRRRGTEDAKTHTLHRDGQEEVRRRRRRTEDADSQATRVWSRRSERMEKVDGGRRLTGYARKVEKTSVSGWHGGGLNLRSTHHSAAVIWGLFRSLIIQTHHIFGHPHYHFTRAWCH